MTRTAETSRAASLIQALTWAKDHKYKAGQYDSLNSSGIKRRRLTPEHRSGLLLNIYIDASIGKVHSNKEASIWHIGHTEIQEICVRHDEKMSVASVFNYFNDRDNLTDCIVAWASNNIESDDLASASAAMIILNQYAAVRPAAAAELGIISMPLFIKGSITDSATRWAESYKNSSVKVIKNKARKVLREA